MSSDHDNQTTTGHERNQRNDSIAPDISNRREVLLRRCRRGMVRTATPCSGVLHRQRVADRATQARTNRKLQANPIPCARATDTHTDPSWAHLHAVQGSHPAFISGTRSQPDDRTYRRRRVPRTTPPRRTSQLDRLAEQLHPPQVAKKPAHTLPQLISTQRRQWAHQLDQQTEHHIVTADDRLVGPDQHRIIGKPPTQLPQLPQKLLPTHTDTHALPSLPRSTGRTHHDQTITIALSPSPITTP